MDRRRRRSGALVAGLLLAAAGLAGAQGPPLRALDWLAPGTDPAVLTREPAECYAPPPERRASAEIGRAAFRTPVLLGGQAARAGLSCESCHRGGRTHPQFLFPGVSGAPGTADVTSSLFSSHRGNGRDDPVPIPDLSGPRARLKVPPEQLAPFIHGLVTQEFDGPEPSPAVLAGLVDYVRALSPAACPAQPDRPVNAAGLADDARRAALAGAGAHDPATRLLMIAAARARLGLIDERLPGPAFAVERPRLRAADTELAALAAAARSGAPDTDRRLAAWAARAPSLAAGLARREPRSLFDPKTLRAAVQPGLPAKAS